MWILYNKNKIYNGKTLGVQFKDGVGKTDNPKIMEQFKNLGFVIEEERKSKVSNLITGNETLNE